MALTAFTAEVRTTGSDTNGGAYANTAGGTDYSQRDTNRSAGAGDTVDLSTTDAVANGTTTITSATANFTSALKDNVIYLQGGSGSLAAGWYRVTAVGSATSITLDRSVAAGTGITMNIGGAFASPGQACAIIVANSLVYVKSGTYPITATTTGSGGVFSTSAGSVQIIGYKTTRGDNPTGTDRPLLQASGITSFTLVSITGGGAIAANLRADGASLTGSRCYTIGGSLGMGINLDAVNATNSGYTLGIVIVNRCTASNISSGDSFLGVSNQTTYVDCVASGGTTAGFANGISATRCLAVNNTGAAVSGFVNIKSVVSSLAYGNGQHGFANCTYIESCLSVNNGSRGYSFGSAAAGQLLNCADYNNTAGRIDNIPTLGDVNPINLTGDPFTNAAGNDFSLNNTAGAGAACRAAGFPGVLPFGGTGYLDVGALQHQDSGGATAGQKSSIRISLG